MTSSITTAITHEEFRRSMEAIGYHKTVAKREEILNDILVLERYDGMIVGLVNGDIFYFNNIRDRISHNLEGPASVCSDGTISYFINGERLTVEQFDRHPLRVPLANKIKARKALGL